MASDKDFEILLLRRQLAIYERKQARTPHLSGGEKLLLVVLATQVKAKTGRTWELEGRNPPIKFLIRDNDKKFTTAFDTVFCSEGIDVIPTPYHAPNANTFAERWIRSVREECLDKLLIINQAHLHRVMREYTEFFNTSRPHQGLEQRIPIPKMNCNSDGPVRCGTVLGGILHDYYRDAA